MLLYALFLVCTRIREENTTFIPKFLVFCLTICKIDCDKSGETGEKGITKRLLVRWLKKIEKNTEKDSALHSHISLSSQAKFWDHLLLLLIISNSSYRLSHGFLSKWPYSLVQLSVLVTLGCYKKKNTTDLVNYKQQTFISHCSRGWKSKIKAPVDSGSDEGHLFGSSFLHVTRQKG